MRRYTLSEVNYALADIKETLAIWRDSPIDHPYVAQLLTEWDKFLDLKRDLQKC